MRINTIDCHIFTNKNSGKRPIFVFPNLWNVKPIFFRFMLILTSIIYKYFNISIATKSERIPCL